MKYKLIKPLPLYEVGDGGFYIDSDGNLQHATASCGEVVYGAKVLVSHPNILTDWFEEIPEKPKTVYELKDGDEWYFINYNSANCYVSITHNLSCIQSFREVGNVFLTRKDAEKELARRKAKVILERDTKGFKPSEENNWKSWQVFWDIRMPNGEELDATFNYGLDGSLTFSSQEDAKASIKSHKKEWNIYLGVEEQEDEVF